MTQRTKRTEKLDLRLSRAAKQTLQAAANAERKSVSEFVLDTALSEAEERLGDRRIFMLDAKKLDAFIAALGGPPRPHPRPPRVFSRTLGIRSKKRTVTASLQIEKLHRSHAVDQFICGQPELDRFLVRHALRAQQANSSQTYVAVKSGDVIGYYTIVAGEIRHADA